MARPMGSAPGPRPSPHRTIGTVLLLGVLIGGFVAWHWKLVHYTWQDWRAVVGRMKRARALFWRNLLRGAVVTAGAAILLYVITR